MPTAQYVKDNIQIGIIIDESWYYCDRLIGVIKKSSMYWYRNKVIASGDRV